MFLYADFDWYSFSWVIFGIVDPFLVSFRMCNGDQDRNEISVPRSGTERQRVMSDSDLERNEAF